jgi:hypothetical protein
MFLAERPSTAHRQRRGCGSRPTDATMRRSPPAQPSEGRSSSKLTRVDQATRARSTGAELDGDGSDWRWGLMKPRGQDEERNEAKQRRQGAAADLAGAHRSRARSASATRIARERIGLGFQPRGGESEGGGWAGPSQFGQTT